jgi:hypothetical protein
MHSSDFWIFTTRFVHQTERVTVTVSLTFQSHGWGRGFTFTHVTSNHISHLARVAIWWKLVKCHAPTGLYPRFPGEKPGVWASEKRPTSREISFFERVEGRRGGGDIYAFTERAIHHTQPLHHAWLDDKCLWGTQTLYSIHVPYILFFFSVPALYSYILAVNCRPECAACAAANPGGRFAELTGTLVDNRVITHRNFSGFSPHRLLNHLIRLAMVFVVDWRAVKHTCDQHKIV